MLAFRAAGFMATSTLGESPGVEMSWSEMWTWKADTPARVPAGARISAGKSGKVARSFPRRADVVVNRSPASCMPSPESPANRMTTRSTRWGAFGSVVVSDTVLLFVLLIVLVHRAQSPDTYSALLLSGLRRCSPGSTPKTPNAEPWISLPPAPPSEAMVGGPSPPRRARSQATPARVQAAQATVTAGSR